MKKLKRFLMFFLVLQCCLAKAQQPFTPGNIVVLRVGDGTTALTTAMAPVFLDEYNLVTNQLVQSIAMPSSSGNLLTLSGTVNTSGLINLSSDGRYILVGGFNLAVGSSSTTSTPKTIALVDINGAVNASTVYSNATTVPSSVVSDNGINLWHTSSNGLAYIPVGGTSTTVVGGGLGANRGALIANGQLYGSGSSATLSITKVGTGLPTSAATATTLTGTPITGGHNQFALVDLDPNTPGPDVIYAATLNNGILKYSLVGGSWQSNGALGVSDVWSGLTLKAVGNNVTIFATRKGSNVQSSGGQLVSFTDNSGYNATITGTPTVIAEFTGADVDKKAFRGVAFVPTAPTPKISAKIFLQGAYNAGLGRHKDVTATWASVLNGNALLQPYNTAAFGNYAGTESVVSGFFQSTGNTTDIVDWVLVELHDATTPSTIIARRAAFVREDGQVVDLDGVSPVSFPGTSSGSYYLVIKHRNHLPIRSSVTITVDGSPGASATSYDFTTAQSQAYQDGTVTSNAAMKDISVAQDGSGPFLMWGGNVNQNTKTNFLGINNDAIALLTVLGGNQSTTSNNVYSPADVNMDGKVNYLGINNDAIALLTVLGGNQAATVNQHQ